MIPSLNAQQTHEYLSKAGFAPIKPEGRRIELTGRVLYVVDDIFKDDKHFGDGFVAYPSFTSIGRPKEIYLDSNDRWLIVYEYDKHTRHWALMADGTALRVKKPPLKSKEVERFITPENLLIKQ